MTPVLLKIASNSTSPCPSSLLYYTKEGNRVSQQYNTVTIGHHHFLNPLLNPAGVRLGWTYISPHTSYMIKTLTQKHRQWLVNHLNFMNVESETNSISCCKTCLVVLEQTYCPIPPCQTSPTSTPTQPPSSSTLGEPNRCSPAPGPGESAPCLETCCTNKDFR